MLYLKSKGIDLSSISQYQNLNKETKNEIYNDLEKGHCIFVSSSYLKKHFDKSEQERKSARKTYKVGFLYDLLTEVYPDKNKTEKQKIISEKYGLEITYRQFKTILDKYEEDKSKYII